jgi:tetratricopeptide (TPR) repeat protein
VGGMYFRMVTTVVRGAVFLAALVLAGCQHGSLSLATRPAEARLADREEVQRRVGELTAQAGTARRAGRLDSACDLLKEAVGIGPTDGPAQHLLGLVYFEQGDLYNAAVHLDLASRLLSDRFEPCYNLGRALEAGGQYDLAIRSYQRSLSRRLDHLETLENLARVRLKAGYRDEETLRLLNRCLDRERRADWLAWLQTEAERLRGRLGRDPQPLSFSQVPACGGHAVEEASPGATD